MRLSDAVIIAPENARARAALLEHLTGLAQAAGHLGFAHLESALADTIERLERESFSVDALDVVRALAGRYVSLAAMSSGSGTHEVGFAPEGLPDAGEQETSFFRRARDAGEAPMDDSERLQRENVRAQSAVAMHREPANRAPKISHPIWRVSLGPGASVAVTTSGIDADLAMIARIVGAGFILLLAGTVAILLRGERWKPTAATHAVTPMRPAPVTEIERVIIEAPPPERPEAVPGLHSFSGALRPGVDPALRVADGQGVLELDGPSEVTVDVDGVDCGPLPIALTLDPGRHMVRYHRGPKNTVRFYTVEPGATRALRIVTLPGGLIDAR